MQNLVRKKAKFKVETNSLLINSLIDEQKCQTFHCLILFLFFVLHFSTLKIHLFLDLWMDKIVYLMILCLFTDDKDDIFRRFSIDQMIFKENNQMNS